MLGDVPGKAWFFVVVVLLFLVVVLVLFVVVIVGLCGVSRRRPHDSNRE